MPSSILSPPAAGGVGGGLVIVVLLVLWTINPEYVENIATWVGATAPLFLPAQADRGRAEPPRGGQLRIA
ncbi:hypothetical protein ACWGCK_21010 [Streptomyces virginiae]